jgi:hypothetical protein
VETATATPNLEALPTDGRPDPDLDAAIFGRIEAPGHPLHGLTGRILMRYYSWLNTDYTMYWLAIYPNTPDRTERVLGVYLVDALA